MRHVHYKVDDNKWAQTIMVYVIFFVSREGKLFPNSKGSFELAAGLNLKAPDKNIAFKVDLRETTLFEQVCLATYCLANNGAYLIMPVLKLAEKIGLAYRPKFKHVVGLLNV